MEIKFDRLFKKGEEDFFWDCLEFSDKPEEKRQYSIPHYHFVGQYIPGALRKKVLNQLTDAFRNAGIDLIVSDEPSLNGISMKLEIQGERWSVSGKPRHLNVGAVSLEHGKWSIPSGIVSHLVCAQYTMPRVEGLIHIPENQEISTEALFNTLHSAGYSFTVKPEI